MHKKEGEDPMTPKLTTSILELKMSNVQMTMGQFLHCRARTNISRSVFFLKKKKIDRVILQKPFSDVILEIESQKIIHKKCFKSDRKYVETKKWLKE